MKTNNLALKCTLGLTALLVLATAAHAGPRTSTNYNIPTDTTDAGGQRTTSTSYSNDGSVGGVVGISTVSSPAQTAKAGYIGQLYEVTALQLAASPATINETSTRQLSAAQVLDDDSTLAVSAASVTWSVMAGPLSGINASGLATAATVFEDSAATAQGAFEGLTGQLALTVLDTIPDNFGSYAADGLDDAWQNQYFSANPADAAPLLDPDGDGQNNFFEFTAGLIPTDPASRFLLRVEPVPGQPTQKNLVFSPRFVDRSYVVKFSTDLSPGPWGDATVSVPSDNGIERTVTDTAASETRKFYRVEITKP